MAKIVRTLREQRRMTFRFHEEHGFDFKAIDLNSIWSPIDHDLKTRPRRPVEMDDPPRTAKMERLADRRDLRQALIHRRACSKLGSRKAALDLQIAAVEEQIRELR